MTLGPCQPAHHRADGQVELLGHLAIRVFVEIKHHDQHAELRRQLVDGLLKLLPVDRLIAGNLGRDVVDLHLQAGRRHRPPLSHRPQETVAEHHIQPIAGRVHVAQLLQVFLSRQEDLLREVLGVGHRPGQPVGVSVDRLMVVGDQLRDVLITWLGSHRRSSSMRPKRAPLFPGWGDKCHDRRKFSPSPGASAWRRLGLTPAGDTGPSSIVTLGKAMAQHPGR